MHLNIAVGIPTVSRPTVLRETLAELARQARPPDNVIVCATKPADIDGAIEAADTVRLIISQPGLARQRNALITAASDADVVVFFDDDFLPHTEYLAAVDRYMAADPRVVVVTGRVLADGIGGPGLSAGEARAILAEDVAPAPKIKKTFSGYGCNMALRLAPMRRHGLSFDERLPLYGWQEDVDLSRRLAEFGLVVRLEAARGVHLGIKLGRGSGLQLGYSQIANPIYLAGKRQGYPFGRALGHAGRNMAMNVLRSPWPEDYIDRRGRLRGNVLALWDLATGRLRPERVLDL